MNWLRPTESRARALGSIIAVGLLALGAVRFAGAGLLPAMTGLKGDFGYAFPAPYFAELLRPEFPTSDVWNGWNYGPMLHFFTLPLFLVPRWSMIPPVWALANLAFLGVSFVLVRRLPGLTGPVPWTVPAALAGLWLFFQPLANCFSQGNIEILELALILGAIVLLPRSKGLFPGVLIGLATMTKFLPVGFLLWLLIRRQWRAVAAGIATIAIIAAIAEMTLGWKDSLSKKLMTSAATEPSQLVGLHELSVSSLFLHRASLLDYGEQPPQLRWFPSARGAVAARAGGVASGLLAIGFGILLFSRRGRPVSPFEISVLFMTMFMILPWNHDYYYFFALVPLSVLFLKSVARRDWRLLTITIIAYLIISPPIPFAWVDRTGWFAVPFAYVLNYHDVPFFGGLLLWIVVTYQMLSESSESARPGWLSSATRRVAVTAILVLAVITIAFLWLSRTSTVSGISSSLVGFQPSIFLAGSPALALSPDGARVAYVASVSEARGLCIRQLAHAVTTCVPGTDDAAGPFFSHDGRWIGFFSGGALKKVPVSGSPVEVICPAPEGHSASWGRDGTILFADPGGIYRVSPGNQPEHVIAPLDGDGLYATPTMMPSGETVLFTIAPPGGAFGAGVIAVQSLRTTGRRKILMSGSQPHFDEATGYLVYAFGGRVLAAPLDPKSLELTGLSRPLVSNLLVTVSGGAHFAVGERGALLYVSGNATPVVRRTLVWVDRQGNAQPLPIPPNAFETPRLSPDGRTLAVAIRDLTTDLWTFDLPTGTPARLTFSSETNDTPVWMPAGHTVSFTRSGGREVFTTPVDGGDRQPLPRLWGGGLPVRLGSWSPGGQVLGGTQAGNLWLFDTTMGKVTTSQTRGRVTVIQTPATERSPAFSPDGRWLAYTSNESGRNEVYVESFPGLRDRRQVSTEGGAEPVWSGDGRELFYRGGDAIVAVPVNTQQKFVAGAPRPMFRDLYAKRDGETNYDVAPDGQRFLMIKMEPSIFQSDVRLLRGWSALLPR